MTDRSPYEDSPRGIPGLVKVVGIGLIIVVLLVAVMMLIGGGGVGHTPPPGAH